MSGFVLLGIKFDLGVPMDALFFGVFFLPKTRSAIFKYVKDTSARKEITFCVPTGDKTASVEFKLQQRRFRLDIKKKAI